jgi:hypothetical protein
VRVSVSSDQLLVGEVADPFALWLESSGEGALRGMLRFFLWYPPSAFGFRTALSGFADEDALAVLDFTYVLVVSSSFC